MIQQKSPELKDKFNILVVDDEPDILSLIYEILHNEKYNVETELDPKKALQKIEQFCYDVIVTDLVMPELDGLNLANAIQTKNYDTKVIVITGHATVASAIQAIQLKVYDYINKPVDQLKIKNIVERAIENLSLQRKNIKLQKNNEQILSNLSLLIDISKILFQVTEISHAFEMIIDTITDYFEYDRCAILTEDIQTGIYKIVTSKNINNSLKLLNFKLPQIINDIEISSQNETIIPIKNSKLKSAQTIIDQLDPGWLVLIPVSFQDITLGFIAIHAYNKIPSADEMTMFNILATQVAPVMKALNKQSEKTAFETSVAYRIRESIDHARDILSPISFALLRFNFYSPSGDAFAYKNLIQSAQDYISQKINSETVLHWQARDTALLIMPQVDYFKAETFCKNLKNLTENIYKPNENGAKVEIFFSCLSFPEGGSTAKEITEHLWAKLFQEINFTESEHFVNHI